MEAPGYKEDHISRIPALQMLINLGYTYLSPAEAELYRNSPYF
jgi:type I restriction enzyme R subunit